jgi:hypothetical protein
MPIYVIMPEIDEYIDNKRNQQLLVVPKREWMFEQKQLW